MTPKFIMYWEKADKEEAIPAHIQACINIMANKYREDFCIYNENSIVKLLDVDLSSKNWNFGTLENNNVDQIKMSIIAKSDFIRMRYIYLHGGVWIDSDALNVGDAYNISSMLAEHRIIWGYEAFFGAQAGCELFRQASDNMLEADCQTWGNPGKIKDLLKTGKYNFTEMPSEWLEPRKKWQYDWTKTDLLLRNDIDPDDFIGEKQIFLHLHNKILSDIVRDDNNKIQIDEKSLIGRIINRI